MGLEPSEALDDKVMNRAFRRPLVTVAYFLWLSTKPKILITEGGLEVKRALFKIDLIRT